MGNPGSGVLVRRFVMLAGTGKAGALNLEALVADVAPLGGCACAIRTDVKLVGSPLRRRMEMDVTWRDGARCGPDVVMNASRYLCMRDDGQRQHSVEAFENGVAAAGKSGGNPEACRHGDGVHFDARRLTSECDVLPRHRLVRCSRRGNGLDRDSPVLRIRMETTRASLLWQAAAVRPEPEKDCLV